MGEYPPLVFILPWKVHFECPKMIRVILPADFCKGVRASVEVTEIGFGIDGFQQIGAEVLRQRGLALELECIVIPGV